MRVLTRLTGTSPLVMHNVRLADPSDSYSREIEKFTSKKNMSTEDQGDVDRLKFLGGLYVGKTVDGIVMPTANVRRCFQAAATIRRLGKDVTRAVIPVTQEVALDYPGPKDPEALWKDPQFRYSTMVRIGRSRIPQMRPWFPKWDLEVEWELVASTLDYDDFEGIVKSAGIIEGLGDNRINGMGRFTAEVKQL